MGSSNVSSVVNFFATANEGFTTTLNGSILSAATTVPLTSTSGLTNGTVFVGIIDPGLTTEQTFTGTVDTSGAQITGVKWTRGSNVAHTGGATIVDYVTGTRSNMATVGILKQHTQPGAHTGITTDTIATTGAATVGGTLGVTGATTLTGAVGGAGYSLATISNPYKFSVYASSTTALTQNTWTKVILNAKSFDTSSNFDATTNYRFTAPVAGFYQINLTVQIGSAGLGSNTYGVAAIYKNGTVFKQGLQVTGSGSSTIIPTSQVSDVIQLAQNDYLEAFALCSDLTRAVGSGANFTFMSGFLVSAT